jgi:small subunit ribosomal protein S8e
MVEWHGKSKRMKTGGKRNTLLRCTKKLASKGGTIAKTVTDSTVEKEEREVSNGLGRTKKVRATALKYANVTDGKKTTKLEVISVKLNDANRLFARSNISTKGAIIRVKTADGEKTARVTSRPGQNGIVNAKFE